jgi:hypothetical protein
MKSYWKRAFWLACILFASLAPAAAQDTLSAEAAMARVRKATGYEKLRSQTRGLFMGGTTRFRGLDSKFTFLFTPDGKFRTEIEGPLGGSTGFDGSTGWEVDWTGMPRVLELEDLETAQFHAWTRSGRWLAEDGPFAFSLDAAQTDDKQVALKLSLRKGLLEATAFIDRATWLPQRITRTMGGSEVTEFGDYREVMGFRFPHRISRKIGNVTSVFEISSVAPAPDSSQARFKPVTTRPADARWDTSAPARLEVRRARSGHMLVHPLVNGKDVGWFILDSGAAVMVIDKKAADQLGMPAFGEIVAVGAAGMTKARFRQGETFRLGPVSINGLKYMELDLEFLSNAFGVPVGGVCGQELFSRAVVEIDISNESVALHDPARYRLEGAAWQELLFSGHVPVVRARFEGREGLFKLDTGSDRAVSLHAPAVERYKLLSGRDTAESQTGGVGGSGESRTGKLALFEFAGRRFESLDVEFSGARQGAFSDVYTTGNIGAALLREFRLVFDYGNKRVAFAPLKLLKPEQADRAALAQLTFRARLTRVAARLDYS